MIFLEIFLNILVLFVVTISLFLFTIIAVNLTEYRNQNFISIIYNNKRYVE